MRVAISSGVVFLVLFGLYLGLAGEADAIEIGAGMICAAAGTALALGLARVAHRRFRLRPPLRAILRPVAALVSDAASVGLDLMRVAVGGARGQRGAFVRQPFEPGGDDASAAGRRALAVLGISLAPGAFVIRGERSETLILHAMPPKPVSQDPRWPA